MTGFSRMSRGLVTDSAREITDRYNIASRVLKGSKGSESSKRLDSFTNAKRGMGLDKLFAMLRTSTKPINYERFRGTRAYGNKVHGSRGAGGVQVKIRKSGPKVKIRSAFIKKIKSTKPAVFIRAEALGRGKGVRKRSGYQKLPIVALGNLTASKLVPFYENQIVQKAHDRFDKAFDARYKMLLSRLK